jgi:hypothetical protein
MNILVLKCLIMPLLIWMATFAGRRWGNQVGGWVAGLPVTSAPISIFLFVERGEAFAARAAVGSAAGILGAAAFALCYSRLAPRSGWANSLFAGLTGYGAAVVLLHFWDPGLAAGAPIVVLAFAVVLCLIPRQVVLSPPAAAPTWDLPARMVVATIVVVGLTTAASFLGSSATGLLSPVPVATAVLSCFAHARSGGHAARQVLRGMVLSGFAFVAFFAILAIALSPVGPGAYVVAAIGAGLVHGGVLVVDSWLSRTADQG